MHQSRLKIAVVSALSVGLVLSSVSVAIADPPRRGGPKVVYAQKYRSNNNARNIGLGVGAVIIGGVIASEAARANGYSYRGNGLSCRQLERRCDDGSNWACRQLEIRSEC